MENQTPVIQMDDLGGFPTIFGNILIPNTEAPPISEVTSKSPKKDWWFQGFILLMATRNPARKPFQVLGGCHGPSMAVMN